MLTAHLNQKITELIPQGAPFAIAFSGGGDSTALVYALRNHPQAKHIYIVDHNLRAGSDVEAQAAKRFADACGYDSKILKWINDSPETAIQEKARRARYGHMGHECRKDGVEYLLTAHSEDDQAETLLMRYDRKTDWRGAAGMAEVTYAPIWPSLYHVSLVRPLLGISRQELRDYNRQHKLSWTEDPSNENRDYARIRARDYLKTRADVRADLLMTAQDMRECLVEEKRILREQCGHILRINPNGFLTLRGIPMPELMLQSIRCVSGQNLPINRAKVRYLVFRMRDQSFRSSTLGGALIFRHNKGFIISRDPVSVKGRQDSHHERVDMRRNLKFRLSDVPRVWDGRFVVTGPRHRSYMSSIFHDWELLTDEQLKFLKTVPGPVRPTLPVSKHENNIRIIGHGGSLGRVTQCLVKTRLEAALGGKLS